MSNFIDLFIFTNHILHIFMCLSLAMITGFTGLVTVIEWTICVHQVKESYLHAKMDFECRMQDAQFLAYPPVVAGSYLIQDCPQVQVEQM